MLAIYNNVVEIAKKKGVALKEIEKETGMGNGALSKWKHSIPGVDKVLIVAKALGVEISELLKTEEGEQDYDGN